MVETFIFYVYYIKDQWGKPLDKLINFGPKAGEEELKRRAYRVDNVDLEDG